MIFRLFLVDYIFGVLDGPGTGQSENHRLPFVNLCVPPGARRPEDGHHPPLIFSFPGDGADLWFLLRNAFLAEGAFSLGWRTHISFDSTTQVPPRAMFSLQALGVNPTSQVAARRPPEHISRILVPPVRCWLVDEG